VKNPGTTEIREKVKDARTQFNYFWFIYNGPSLYDKYIYAIHHVSDDDLKKYVSYKNVPDEQIPFNQHIYGQLQSALCHWSNKKCGSYVSPITSTGSTID
jgi:hypothetical protein